MATRRGVILGAGIGAITVERAMTAGSVNDVFDPGQVARDLTRYASFGVKASGGVGDQASGAWLADEIKRLGFRTQRQAIEVPFFEPRAVMLTLEAGAVDGLIAHAPVMVTPAGGLTARLVRLEPWPDQSLTGAIAVARLPYGRWSGAHSPAVRKLLVAAAAQSAAAVVLITDGPTGEALALNAEADEAMAFPVVTAGTKQGARLLAAAARGETGRLRIEGESGRRSAYNLIGSLERAAGRRLVVSTPRSGWFDCMGERGGGIAAWLGLARWASRECPLDLTFVSTSGHEYENLGGHAFLKSALAPRPEDTRLWAHLGAALAARDWHETEGQLGPLPSVDPQRFLIGRPALVSALRQTFKGQVGLEAAYGDEAGAAGELGEILAAGYERCFGILGAHRFHHARSDDMRCVDAGQVAATGRALLAAVRKLTA